MIEKTLFCDTCQEKIVDGTRYIIDINNRVTCEKCRGNIGLARGGRDEK